jgi:hypothetical protein
MTPDDATRRHPPAADDGFLDQADAEALGFVAEMSGVQLDQLAALLVNKGEPADSAPDRARDMVARWRAGGYVEAGHLSIGEQWVWASRKGLNACEVRAREIRPRDYSLRHIHAVTDVRLAVERTTAYRTARAWWRAERSLLNGLDFPARSEHIPDGEVHYPVEAGSPWAGETWAVEVEISRKSINRIAGIMHEVLTRTSDYGGAPGSITVPGHAPRYARLVYVCSPTSVRGVLTARADVGAPLSARIDVHNLPESAMRLNTLKRGWQS